MGEFKSLCVFNEEPTSKENHRMVVLSAQTDFRWEKCWRSGLSEDTEKRGFPPVHGDEKIFEILVSTRLG